jgi:hypothetical protein
MFLYVCVYVYAYIPAPWKQLSGHCTVYDTPSLQSEYAQGSGQPFLARSVQSASASWAGVYPRFDSPVPPGGNIVEP